MMNDLQPRSQWRSPLSYILVTTGAIIGLGNIIQFPYLISEFGSLFIVFYLLFEVIIALPLLFAELSIGRRGKQNPVGSIDILALESGANYRWRYLGWLCFIVSFLTLAYYTVQAAFPLSYFFGSLQVISHYGTDEPIPVAIHGNMMTHFSALELCVMIFLFATFAVIVRGINKGLEVISWIVVPLYGVILILLALYTCLTGGFLPSLNSLLSMHPEKTVFTVLMAAMAYSFFKLNVGMGSMIVYGSYLPYSSSFRRSTLIILLLDILISVLSFFIIYPLMLTSHSFDFALTNYNVIYIFMDIPHGFLIAALFFFAAVLAAWTCTIAMAETTVITLIERFNYSRLHASLIIFLGALLVATFSVLTHTQWMDVMLNQNIALRGIVKNFTGQFLVPLSALGIAVFAGWIIQRNIFRSELHFSSIIEKIWYVLIKYFAPVLIFILLCTHAYYFTLF